MAEPTMSAESVKAMLTENLARVRKASIDYFDMLEKSLTSSHLPVAEQAKPFCDYMRRQVTASYDLCDKLIQARDVQDTMRIQSEFFQEQMRALTEQAKSVGETAMKAASGVFAPKS